MSAVNLAFVSDEKFLQPTAVTLLSTIKQRRNNQQYNVFIVDVGISSEGKAFAERFFSKYENLSITFIPFDKSLISTFEPIAHISSAMYAKLFLSELLDIERVIYLDGDILVLEDISGLWQAFDDNYCIQAVYNPNYDYDNAYLNIENGKKTFNSGVMMMNLKAMKSADYLERLLAFTAAYHAMVLGDQAAFNVVFKDNWAELPPAWNVQKNFYFNTHRRVGISKSERRALIKAPKIVHFSSAYKPWMLRTYHPNKKVYIQLYEEIFGKFSYSDRTLGSVLRWIKQFYLYHISKLYTLSSIQR